jgi:large subunit ribosomal protein L28
LHFYGVDVKITGSKNNHPLQGEYIMARVCEICGKGPATGNNVSHAHNKNRRRWLPNLQKVRTVTDSGRTVRIRVCTRCIRSGAVVKPA